MTGNCSPLERYEADLKQPGFVPDPAQQQAVTELDALHHDVIEYAIALQENRGWLSRLTKSQPNAPTGLYFWGGVGRGKTYLMDCFYECLPIERKWRVHFHRFMEQVHDQLASLEQQTNPLDIVAENIAERGIVLCFDEFFVVDIADAMILARLLERLFEHGVVLVTTSNIPPDQLYKDGLQRAKFLPAIDLLNQHCQVVNVDSGIDYRLRILEQAEMYHFPLDDAADKELAESFAALSPGESRSNTRIHINHRAIPVHSVTDGVAWFAFKDLCESARSTSDYIEIARRFNTVLLSDVPQMGEGSNDPARRFINLIDELYDRNVNIIITAAVPLEELYQGERLEFEFQRTTSRLIEMQSHDYLAREHRP